MQDVELAEVQQPTMERNQVCCNLGCNWSRERGGGGRREFPVERGGRGRPSVGWKRGEEWWARA